MFPIFMVVALIIGIIYFAIRFSGLKGLNRGRRDKYGAGIIISGVVLFILVLVWSIAYTSSISTVAKIDAFYKATKSAYEYSITATKEIEIKALEKIEGSNPSSPPMQMFDAGGFAYFKLAPTASERIMEFRNRIEWYNSTLEEYSRWNRFWLTKDFIADVPPDLKPIILK